MRINFIKYLDQVSYLELPDKIVFWLCFFVLLIIPFRIFSYNYHPVDDANRHIAKVISGKPWPEILVMDEQYQALDHNQGWHVLLGWIYNMIQDKEKLLVFSSISLSVLFLTSGLFIFQKNPLAWISTLILCYGMTSPYRLFLGRPFIFSSAVFLMLLALWDQCNISNRLKFFVSVILIAISGWIHGAWYLFALLPMGFIMAKRVKDFALISISWIFGSFLAGLLNGEPFLYLVGQVRQSLASVDSAPVTRLLVGEFQPYYDIRILLVLVLFLLMEKIYKPASSVFVRNPSFCIVCICWVLGLRNGRFWLDWGNIALLYFVASSISNIWPEMMKSVGRITIYQTGLLILGLFFLLTSDINSRWSNNDFSDRLSLRDPEHLEWLPDAGGIFYSDSMGLYYHTFYENPDGEWRYMLGHEPALMPKDDLKIYREIQFYGHQGDHLFEPWVDKMTDKDRMVLRRSKGSKPRIEGLEWKYVAYNTWSGKLPEKSVDK